MHDVIIPALYVLAGICLYAFVTHVSVILHRPIDYRRLLFSATCVPVFVFSYFQVRALQAATVDEFVAANRWDIACTCVMLIFLVWFVAAYTDRRPLRFLLGTTAIYVMLFVANLMMPYGLQFDQVTALTILELPWGESIAIAVGRSSTMFLLTVPVLAVTFAFMLLALWSHYRSRRSRSSLAMLGAFGFIAVCAIQGVLVRLSVINFVPLGVIGYLGLIFTTSLVLSHEYRVQLERADQEMERLRLQQWHADRVMRTALLISSLSHEMSQPLTAILSNAQAGLRFLAKGDVDREEIVDILSDIVASDVHARGVIDSLRAVMRHQKTERKSVDMTMVAHDVIKLLNSRLAEQQVEIMMEGEPDCLVIADQGQLQQVMLNLMLNGIDAMREKAIGQRRLQLRVWRTADGEVQVAVRDSGTGIAKDAYENLFEGFWTTKDTGTGMGLPICRSIIESHGGKVWAEAGFGSGATFHFMLPLSARISTPST